MLHDEMMSRYRRELPLAAVARVMEQKPTAPRVQSPGRLETAAAVLGNAIAGGLFLGLLLLLPLVLHRMLALS